MLAFASAGFVLQSSANESQFSVFNLVYRLMLGDFTNFDEYIENQENYLPLWIGMILFTIFLSIIMLNLLISIIGDTYGKVVSAQKSNRTYELLNVIYEIEKFQILGRKKYNNLKERKIIGDYLVCFHNNSHFPKDVENLESHLKENQEIKKKIAENGLELKNGMNENFKNQNTKIDTIQEKIVKIEQKFSNFEKFEEKIIKFE